jgi:hypothetical protein
MMRLRNGRSGWGDSQATAPAVLETLILVKNGDRGRGGYSCSILIGVDATANTPDMEGNRLKSVAHPATVKKDEPRGVRIACHRRCRPIDVRLRIAKGMAEG